MDKVTARQVANSKIARVRAEGRMKCIACSSHDVAAVYQENLGVTITCRVCDVTHTRF